MNNKQASVEINTAVELSSQVNKDLQAKQIDLLNCIKVTGAGVNEDIRHGCEDCPTNRP